MKRHLFRLALLGVLLLPDWASACWWWRRPYQVDHAYYQPVYPAYPVYPQFPVCVLPPECICPTPRGESLPPPRVERGPKQPASAQGLSPKDDSSPTRDQRVQPSTNPIRTIGGTESIPERMPMTPTNTKPVSQPVALPEPFPLPTPSPKYPAVEIPKELGPLPKLDVPKEPDFRPVPTPKGAGGDMPQAPTGSATPLPAPAPRDPSLVLPAVPAGSGNAAIPSPAPAFPEPLIPATSVPVIPDPKQPETLPSLTLPPETPVAPPSKGTLARSSPLTGSKTTPTVSVYPAKIAGDGRLDGYKTVGFYNHTDRDLSLTIEGQTVKLPAKTYLYAMLGPTFSWGEGNQPAVRESVPPGAGGLDVVFRD